MWELDVPYGAEPIGYRFLVDHFKLKTLAHYRWSYVGPGWDSKEFRYDNKNLELHLYPKTFQIDNDPLKHLEFALKHEGVNLLITKQFFREIDPNEVTRHILAAPTGKYARKIWFLYEYLLGEKLPIENVGRGTYVNLLENDYYYTGQARKSPRHRVIDNLLGDDKFSPLVRRSSRLDQFEKQSLGKVAEELTKQYSSDVLARAIRYLYTKETMASWEIEREKPDTARLARFVNLLGQNYTNNELSKRFLIMLQKEIIDHRFVLEDYRHFQNYVGAELQLGQLNVHFIAPKPQDLASLMEGLLNSAARMFVSNIDPVVAAAIISFGFVFMHPFWDGNGRLHRFLIHYVLSKLNFTPDNIIFPVSAVMLREHKDYDRVLEYFSKPLEELISNYDINEQGEMVVNQETVDFYKYLDFTPIAEFLYNCVEKTIQTDLERELDFLTSYDKIKHGIKEIVDMPDKEIDLFIKCVRQNNGTLSKKKHESLFSMLSIAEIDKMVGIIHSSGTS